MNNIENLAMNIVYQLDDDSNLSVEFRQANNDKRIDFVKKLIASHRTPILQSILEKAPRDMELGVDFIGDNIIKGFNQANEEWRQLINNLLKE